jgi:iron complex outermembrane recepter protein
MHTSSPFLTGVLRAVVFALASCNGVAASTESRDKPLKQLTLEELGKVDVTSVGKLPDQLRRTAAAIHVITAEEIRRSGARTLPELLRLAPGVEVAQIDSVKWAVGVRGFNNRLSKSMLVLIDGRSVYTPLFAGVYWEMQDTLLEDIERIEIIRGPGGTIWGSNAVNGVINIITKSSRDTTGTLVTVGSGSVENGFAEARFGGGKDNLSYRVWGKWFTRGPQWHAADLNFDDWRRGQMGFRADVTASPRDSLTFSGDVYKSEVGQSLQLSFFNPPSIITEEDNIDLAGGNLLGRWRRALNEANEVQVQFYYDRSNRQDLNFAEVRNTFDTDLLFRAQLPRNEVSLGAGMRISPSQFTQVVPTVDFQPHDETYRIFSGYVQDQITVVPDKLLLTVGTKLEHTSFSGLNAQPSVRLAWTPSDHQTFWAAVTRAIRTPSRVEENFEFNFLAVPALPLYFRLIGDGGFRPERMMGYEAGYRAFFQPNLLVDLSLYHNRYHGLASVENFPPVVETDPPPPHLVLALLFRNGIVGETTGFEIAPSWEPVPWWRLRASYSRLHLDTRNRPTSNDASTVRQTEGASPDHQVRLQSYITLLRNLELDLAYRYVSKLTLPAVPGYSTADLRFGWNFRDQWRFSVAGRNLFQPQHVEFTGNPRGPVQIRRSVYASLTFEYP